mgnify:CR=1 FL=1
MAVTLRCAVMVGEGAPLGLSSLFYSSNCSRVTALLPCTMVTAMEPEIMCISPLNPPRTTKIALFLKKHHEKFGRVQKSH